MGNDGRQREGTKWTMKEEQEKGRKMKGEREGEEITKRGHLPHRKRVTEAGV